MWMWLSANAGTILVALILAFIVCAVIVKLVKDRRNGKSSCGSNCAHCAMSGSCHKK